jgi:hypothetical protein
MTIMVVVVVVVVVEEEEEEGELFCWVLLALSCFRLPVIHHQIVG